jgi:tetratricopeptide (TPR) repeat protein
MNCHDVEAGDLAARYLAGDLEGAEREAYEEHYFGCDACFRELEILRTTQAVLAKQAPSTGRLKERDPIPRWLPIAAALAAATTLAVWWTSDRGAPPDQARSQPGSPATSTSISPSPPDTRAAELTQMAHFEPPRYEPPRLRGVPATDSAAFDRAMAHYRRGEFAAAAAGIEAYLRRHPDEVRANFFLGVAHLAGDQTEAAVQELERVVSAGDAYEEEALYLLAKAHIRRGDLRAAVTVLDRTLALKGERAAEARALRDRLAVLQQHKQ